MRHPARLVVLGWLAVAPWLAGAAPLLDAVAAAPASPPLKGDALLQRIGFASCLHQARDQSILDVVDGQPWDLFLFMGDNVYGDAEPPALEALAEAYALQARSPGLNRLRVATPVLATWDDHDYGKNDGGASFAGRASAEVLFHEFWHTPADDPVRDRPGVYQSRIVGPEGRRVQIILLDTRSFRAELKATDSFGAPGRERYVPDATPGLEMLGEAQWRWLEARLREPAELRLLVSSVQVIADGHGWEAWRMLPAERDRLYALIDRIAPEGLLILSGDRHRAGIYRQVSGLPYPLYEVTSSSLNLPIAGAGEEAGPRRLGATFTEENFGALEIDWAQAQLTLMILDRAGQPVRTLRLPLSALRPDPRAERAAGP
ncbi:MAG: alkaline phosphatase D family protein [Pseudomonadales bacterium]|jgi:alkaline phosphatase D|nr:alkaline phosphatase D family protein [Pseudomonadales bacterium]